MTIHFLCMFSVANYYETTGKISPPPHINHLLDVIKNSLKPNSRKKMENKFAEITPIFQTNMSLGPKLFNKMALLFGHVDIIILLDSMKEEKQSFKFMIKHFFFTELFFTPLMI